MVHKTFIFALFFFLVCHIARGQQRHWTHPDYVQLQYAGSIGYFSGGAGYNLFNDNARISIHYGFVPAAKGGILNIFSTRFMYVPRVYSISKSTKINPYDFGLMVSYHLGSHFNTAWPDHRYPPNYYWWQTSFRFHLSYQPSITFKLRDHTVFKFATAYVDLNSNELYLVSVLQNIGSVKASDVIKLGVGARLHF